MSQNLIGRMTGQLSSFEVMYAISAYVIDGVQYCDVSNPDSGQAQGVQCIVAGVDGKPLGVPKIPWVRGLNIRDYPLVIVGHRSDGRQPIVIDVLKNTSLVYADNAHAKVAGNNDDTDPSNLNDRVITNGGTTVTIRENGNVVIESAGDVSVQLSGGAVMRVSKGGDAGDRALLATPAIDKFNEGSEAFNALLSALKTASDAAAAAATLTPAGDPGAVFTATLQAALLAVPVMESAVAAQMQSASLCLPSAGGARG